MVEDEPSHLTMSSVERWSYSTNRQEGGAGFWSHPLWMRFLQGTGFFSFASDNRHYFVATTADNIYSCGSRLTIDKNIGKYYHEYIGDYSGSETVLHEIVFSCAW